MLSENDTPIINNKENNCINFLLCSYTFFKENKKNHRKNINNGPPLISTFYDFECCEDVIYMNIIIMIYIIIKK
jgi:hypothetical protein